MYAQRCVMCVMMFLNADITETRIDWCREVINEFFNQDGLHKVLEKEKRKAEHDKQDKLKQTTSIQERSIAKNGQHVEEGVNGKTDATNITEDVPNLKYSCSSV